MEVKFPSNKMKQAICWKASPVFQKAGTAKVKLNKCKFKNTNKIAHGPKAPICTSSVK